MISAEIAPPSAASAGAAQTPQGRSLLLIEDDAPLRRMMTARLTRQGYRVEGAETWAAAQKLIESSHPALILLDIRLPDANGVEILPRLAEIAPVIVVTAYGSVNDAVRAVKAGAADYLVKPVNPDTLEFLIGRALETRAIRRKYETLRDEARKREPALIGSSAALGRVRDQIRMLAPSEATVLIHGESGVGKELVARAVHEASGRREGELVPIDCASLPETLFESELFGYERGAFTGAERRKEGQIELAAGGTLFLDEIGELPLTQQAKLLRVLETGRFRRLGGARDMACDVRFIAATNRDLKAQAQEGSFRLDLYYRLSALEIHVPPLRERPEDAAEIAEFFISNRKFDRGAEKRLTPAARAALQAHDWPGNARELRNVVERALLASQGETDVTPAHLGFSPPPGFGAGASAAAKGVASFDAAGGLELRFPAPPTLHELRDVYLRLAAQRCNGRRAAIARLLGVSERNVYRLMEELENPRPEAE